MLHHLFFALDQAADWVGLIHDLLEPLLKRQSHAVVVVDLLRGEFNNWFRRHDSFQQSIVLIVYLRRLVLPSDASGSAWVMVKFEAFLDGSLR